jgi:hypothetical protein
MFTWEVIWGGLLAEVLKKSSLPTSTRTLQCLCVTECEQGQKSKARIVRRNVAARIPNSIHAISPASSFGTTQIRLTRIYPPRKAKLPTKDRKDSAKKSDQVCRTKADCAAEVLPLPVGYLATPCRISSRLRLGLGPSGPGPETTC